MNNTEKLTVLGLIVIFVLLFIGAYHKDQNWLPPGAKLIRIIDKDWKLVEISGQKYQVRSPSRLVLPYQQ